MRDRRKKPDKIKQKKDLKLFCFLNNSGNKLHKLTMFFCENCHRPRH